MGTLVFGQFGESINTDELDHIQAVDTGGGSFQMRAFASTGSGWLTIGGAISGQPAAEARLAAIAAAVGWVAESDPLLIFNPKRVVYWNGTSGVVEFMTEGGASGVVSDFLYIPGR